MESGRLSDELLARTLAVFIRDIGESPRVYCSGWSQALLDESVCRVVCKVLSAVSQTCRHCRDAINVADLWRTALQIVIWPMSRGMDLGNVDGRSLHIKQLGMVGSTSRSLYVDCMQLLHGDLAEVGRTCPSIATLTLSFLGPEGTGGLEWISTWRRTLKCLNVHFRCDACLGPPQIYVMLCEVLSGSDVLEEMCLKGVDWPRARMDILEALQSRRGQCPSLRRLMLEGCCCPSDEQLAPLRASGIAVRTRVGASRVFDDL